MPNDSLPSLSPEQIAAVAAGDGFAYWEDPETHRLYLIVDKGVAPAPTEEYFRAKIAVGITESERGESRPWDSEMMKRELRVRFKSKKRLSDAKNSPHPCCGA